MIETRIAHPAPETTPTTTRKKGTCAGRGTTAKTLVAPDKGAGHGYTGPMYCLACCPRFKGGAGILRMTLA